MAFLSFSAWLWKGGIEAKACVGNLVFCGLLDTGTVNKCRDREVAITLLWQNLTSEEVKLKFPKYIRGAVKIQRWGVNEFGKILGSTKFIAFSICLYTFFLIPCFYTALVNQFLLISLIISRKIRRSLLLTHDCF